MTKEEMQQAIALEFGCNSWYQARKEVDADLWDILLDRYAKQESIAFAEWALLNNYRPINWLDNKYWTNESGGIANYLTTEQLYQLYQSSLTNQ